MKNLNDWQWLDYAELSSTNDTAAELCVNPPASKFVVTCRSQTGGRGRRGRSWISLEGNLFMSQAFPCDIRFAGDLVFIISLSVLETVRYFSAQIDIKLKWPNDVLVNGCKISGILLEKAENGYIIAGTGVNITTAPERDSRVLYPTASLKDFGIITDRCEFLKIYLEIFDRNFSLWQKRGFPAIKEIWLQNAGGLNEEISVNLEKKVERGFFRGIGDDGALLLDQNGSITRIYAGDVFYTKEKSKN